MSGIFSLMKESSIPYNVFASSYLRERYVESSIGYLSSINDVITEQVKELYSNILEADNIDKENAVIKDFIVSSNSEIDKLAMNIKSQVQRFSISLSNLCSNIKDKVNGLGSRDVSNYCYTDRYVNYDRAKMLNSDIPQMNPYKIFERDFNFIGQLMQDLPVTSSNKDKLEIVSTVYKNFKKSTDSNILGKTYQDLFGVECSDKTKCPSSIGELVCGMFITSKDDQHKIDSTAYADAVECIENCDEFLDSITTMADHLINELRHVMEDLEDILEGDRKNRFKVDTKEDGIKNTSYSIDKYTSNKIMWLVQEKIRQIVNVFNKYIIALSVKMECICNYVQQSSDIINSFTYMDKASTCSTKSDDGDLNNDGEISQEEEDESKEDNALDGGDDILTDEDETENDVEASDGESDDTEEGSEIEEVSDDEPEADFEVGEDEGEDLKEASMDILTSIHEYNMACNELSILEYAASILMEDDSPEAKDKIAGAKEVIGKAAEQKQSLWKNILDKIFKMWESFKDALSKSYNLKVDKLKEAGVEKAIKTAPIKAEVKMPTIKLDELDKIKIVDLNYESMKKYMGSKEDFIAQYYKEYRPKKEGDSLSKAIEDMVFDREHMITDSTQLKLAEFWNYVSKYPAYANEMREMTNTINQGQRKAASIAKSMTQRKTANESAMTLEDLYFNEAESKFGAAAEKDADKKHDTDPKVQEERDDITKHMGVYFGVSGDILHAKIVVSQKVFNEFYAALMWHCNKVKEGGSKSGGGEAPKQDEGSTNDTTLK